MKRLFLLVTMCGLLGALPARGQTNVAVFSYGDFAQTPQVNRRIYLYPIYLPSVNSAGITTSDRWTLWTDPTNGLAFKTNMLPGLYRGEFQGVWQPTTNWFTIDATNTGLFYMTGCVASAYVLAGSKVPAYSMSQADARFARIGSTGGGSVPAGMVTNGQSDVTLRGTFSGSDGYPLLGQLGPSVREVLEVDPLTGLDGTNQTALSPGIVTLYSAYEPLVQFFQAASPQFGALATNADLWLDNYGFHFTAGSLDGWSIQPGTLNSNQFDGPTLAAFGRTGGGGGPGGGVTNNQYLPGSASADSLSVGGVFTWYVDAVNGSDANSGSSVSAPLKTIAAVLAKPLAPGQSVGLHGGQRWGEQFTVPCSSLTVASYGGGLALLDCSDPLTTNVWSKTGGQTSVYQTAASKVVDLSGWVSVWENSNRLVHATSIANCDATAGSYYPSSDTAASITLYIHASDGSSPAESGMVYEMSVRSFGLDADPYSGITNTTVRGIWTRRNVDNNGSIELQGQMYDCLATEGTKHNVLIGNGSYLYNVTARDCYFGPTLSSTLFVMNADVASGSATFEDCTAVCTVSNAMASGFYAHPNVSGNFDTITWINPVVGNCGSGITGNCTNLVVIGGVLTNCWMPMEVANRGVFITNTVFAGGFRGLQIDNQSSNVVVQGCAFIGTPSQYQIYSIANNARIGVYGCFFTNGSAAIASLTSTTAFSVISNSMFSAVVYSLVSTNQYKGDYNFYKAGVLSTAGDGGSPSYKTPAQWAAATGQDAHMAGTSNTALPSVSYPASPDIQQSGLLVSGSATVSGTVTAAHFAGDGSGLTGLAGATPGGLTNYSVVAIHAAAFDNLDFSFTAGLDGVVHASGFVGPMNVTNLSGSLPDSVLSTNVPTKSGTNVFGGTNTFAGQTVLSNLTTVRYGGADVIKLTPSTGDVTASSFTTTTTGTINGGYVQATYYMSAGTFRAPVAGDPFQIGTGASSSILVASPKVFVQGTLTATNGFYFQQGTNTAPTAAGIGGTVGSVTNHLMKNVNGALVDYWSDGTTLWSKQLAP